MLSMPDTGLSDVLGQYRREISQIPLLDPAKEIELGKRMEAAKTDTFAALLPLRYFRETMDLWHTLLRTEKCRPLEIVNVESFRKDHGTEDGSDDYPDSAEGEIRSSVVRKIEETIASVFSPGCMCACSADAGEATRRATLLNSVNFQIGRVVDLVSIARGHLPAIQKIDRSLLEAAMATGEDRVQFLDRLENGRLGRDLVKSVANPILLESFEAISSECGCREYATARRQMKRIASAFTGYERAKEEMVRANLRLVLKVARPYIHSGVPILDLVQEGNIGLMRAVERYDWRQGYRFSTYATWWIRQAVSRAAIELGSTIRKPIHLEEALRKVRRAEKGLREKLGRSPTNQELAAETGIPADKIRRLMKANSETVSLFTPVSGDEDACLGDFVEDPRGMRQLDTIATGDLISATNRALQKLSPREERVLRMRYGLGGCDEQTLEEVGQHFCVSRERIRQIEAKAMTKLRRQSGENGLRAHLD